MKCVYLERQRSPDGDDDRPLLEVDGHQEGRLPHVHVVGDVHQLDLARQPGQQLGVGGQVAAAAVVLDHLAEVILGFGLAAGQAEAAEGEAELAGAGCALVAPQVHGPAVHGDGKVHVVVDLPQDGHVARVGVGKELGVWGHLHTGEELVHGIVSLESKEGSIVCLIRLLV